MNKNYCKLREYLDRQQVYYPIFLENVDMEDEQVWHFCQEHSTQEIEEWVNMYV